MLSYVCVCTCSTHSCSYGMWPCLTTQHTCSAHFVQLLVQSDAPWHWPLFLLCTWLCNIFTSDGLTSPSCLPCCLLACFWQSSVGPKHESTAESSQTITFGTSARLPKQGKSGVPGPGEGYAVRAKQACLERCAWTCTPAGGSIATPAAAAEGLVPSMQLRGHC